MFVRTHFEAVSFVSCYGYHDVEVAVALKYLRRFRDNMASHLKGRCVES